MRPLSFVLALTLVMALAALPGSASPAACDGLFISEYVEGTANNKAIEVFNGTGQAVDLSGYTLEFYFNGSTTPGSTIPLAGSLAAGDVFVAADHEATSSILAVADQTYTASSFNGDDAVVLKNGATVIDAIGQVGVDPGSAWGSGSTTTQDHTLRRKASVGVGDGNPSDPFDPAAEWDGYPVDTFDGLGSHAATCARPEIVINEVDSDTPGTDTAEFVELYDGGAGNTQLDGLVVVLYNGGDDRSYAAFDLDGLSTNPTGIVVLGNASLAPGVTFPDGLLQNGADAVALYAGNASDFPNGTPVTTANLLDALVYDTSDVDDPGLLVLLNPGQPQVDEAGGSDPAGQSSARCPNGSGGARNTSTYEPVPPTPGAANACGNAFGQCGDPATPIHAIQGAGAASPLVGSTAIAEGVVVGDYQDTTTGLSGFFVEDQNPDADPATSEGLYVYDDGFGVGVAEGDAVRVRGVVAERFGLTSLSSVDRVVVCQSQVWLPSTPVSLPVAGPSAWESLEGMRVAIGQPLTVAEVYNLGRYGEVLLAADGRVYGFTQLNPPSTAGYTAYLAGLALRTILLDDGNAQQNRDPIVYPAPGLSAANTLRVGDTTTGLVGVVDYRSSAYRLQPVAAAPVFVHANPRPAALAPAGVLRVASANVLNYFNGDGAGGGFPTPRGATTLSEFNRQRAKTIAMLAALDADVIGLIEIENDAGPAGALPDLVAGLNAATGGATYAMIDTGVLGTDLIKVALIYKPAQVTPVGPWLTDADSVWSRRPLAQTFVTAGGERFTVVANHFKSKGCDGATGANLDQGDGQGCYNARRVQQAQRLVAWVASAVVPAAGDPDVLLVGDFNAGMREDPLAALVTGGFANLVDAWLGSEAYSYVFDGQSGTLDYALASASLASQTAGVVEWHANADEPRVLDYNEEFKSPGQLVSLYSPDAYRSSDHDPLVVDLSLGGTGGGRKVWMPAVAVQ